MLFKLIKKTWKLLIAYIYPFIKGLLSELDLSINDFISKDYVDDLCHTEYHSSIETFLFQFLPSY